MTPAQHGRVQCEECGQWRRPADVARDTSGPVGLGRVVCRDAGQCDEGRAVRAEEERRWRERQAVAEESQSNPQHPEE